VLTELAACGLSRRAARDRGRPSLRSGGVLPVRLQAGIDQRHRCVDHRVAQSPLPGNQLHPLSARSMLGAPLFPPPTGIAALAARTHVKHSVFLRSARRRHPVGIFAANVGILVGIPSPDRRPNVGSARASSTGT